RNHNPQVPCSNQGCATKEYQALRPTLRGWPFCFSGFVCPLWALPHYRGTAHSLDTVNHTIPTALGQECQSAYQGLMTVSPAASKGLVSRVATLSPCAAAVAAM